MSAALRAADGIPLWDMSAALRAADGALHAWDSASRAGVPRWDRLVFKQGMYRDMAKAAINIRTVFGGKKEQDIEWGIMNGRIYVVQARPYIDKK